MASMNSRTRASAGVARHHGEAQVAAPGAAAARRTPRLRRDQGQPREEEGEVLPLSPDPSPSRHAAGRELLEEFRRRLSVEECEIADDRAKGNEWNAIAAETEVPRTPDASNWPAPWTGSHANSGSTMAWKLEAITVLSTSRYEGRVPKSYAVRRGHA